MLKTYSRLLKISLMAAAGCEISGNLVYEDKISPTQNAKVMVGFKKEIQANKDMKGTKP